MYIYIDIYIYIYTRRAHNIYIYTILHAMHGYNYNEHNINIIYYTYIYIYIVHNVFFRVADVPGLFTPTLSIVSDNNRGVSGTADPCNVGMIVRVMK